MKIVLVNKSASGGGAAVACYRLYQALKNTDIKVSMLVEQTDNTKTDISALYFSSASNKKALCKFIGERLYFLPYERDKSVRFQFSPAVAGSDISKHPLIQEADIIHLHWINHGFLSLKNLNKLFKLNKPIVWTMHDMWYFTGGCHYAGECDNFKNSCGNCHFLKKPHSKDLSYKIYTKKQALWNYAEIYPVACSNWLKTKATESSLLKEKQTISIANPIDIQKFKPLNQLECRKKLGLPIDKKLLLFGAANINDSRKGIKYLLNALKIFHNKHSKTTSDLELVIFGKTKEINTNEYPYKVHLLNFIKDEEQMVNLYNSADAFVLPSLQDNLPNTVMESLSCGVPVIAFNIGGVPEMITHQKNGYLASIKNSDDLSSGIYDVLYNLSTPDLKEYARKTVVTNYSNDIIAQQFLDLYKNIYSQ